MTLVKFKDVPVGGEFTSGGTYVKIQSQELVIDRYGAVKNSVRLKFKKKSETFPQFIMEFFEEDVLVEYHEVVEVPTNNTSQHTVGVQTLASILFALVGDLKQSQALQETVAEYHYKRLSNLLPQDMREDE